MELTPEDKTRIEKYAGWFEDTHPYDALHEACYQGAEYATRYEREKQIGMASEAYAAGLYRASNAEDSETFEDFRRRKNLMTKQVVEAERDELRNKVIDECITALHNIGFDATKSASSKRMFARLNSLKTK